LLSVSRDSFLINLRKRENRARVHFIPDLKVGEFVTLRAPDVLKALAEGVEDYKRVMEYMKFTLITILSK
jgi:hypothetical protein